MAKSKKNKDVADIVAAVLAVLETQPKAENKRRTSKSKTSKVSIKGHPSRKTWTKKMREAAKAAYLASKKQGNDWPTANRDGLLAAKAAS